MIARGFLVLSALGALAGAAFGQDVREPMWAGQFYNADPAGLAAEIDGYLKAAPAPAGLAGDIKAIIAPHAGYVYSGPTAARAYRLVQGGPYETVVILAPSHRYGFRGCSVYAKGGFKTPLGTAAVDEALAAELMKRAGFKFIPEAHAEEHAVEVQVPFVQRALPAAKIVPVVMGFPDKKTALTLADALSAACAGRKILVVASTDMSHFLTKTQANAADAKTIELIKALDAEGIIEKEADRENILCGGLPVATAILYAQRAGRARAEILGYADSATATGDVSRVVGYVSAALVVEDGGTQAAILTDEDKKELLGLARSAVEAYVQDGRVVQFESTNSRLLAHRGVFVTLKKRGALRGCIGFTDPIMPLSRGVIEAGIYAAVRDYRFEPVSKAELKSLEYEISVLTPLEDVPDPKRIKVGRDGLVIEMNGRKGLLLPQVPVENNWDRETFLAQTCLKAGLPPDSWKKGAKLQRFEAVVFHE